MYLHPRNIFIMVLEASGLIIVCCHGIWLGGPSLGANEAEWLIAPFQHGETPTFFEHLRAGLRILLDSPNSLLMLSGYTLPLVYNPQLC
jgi:hypothetical protein